MPDHEEREGLGPLRLVAVRARNVRSIRDSGWLDLKSTRILVGANNSGKSSLLLAIRFLCTGRGLDAADQFRPERLAELLGEELPGFASTESDGQDERLSVEGQFVPLNQPEPSEAIVHLRRVIGGSIERVTRVAVDERLETLKTKSTWGKRAEVDALAASLGVSVPPGTNLPDTRALILSQAHRAEHKEDWVSAPKSVNDLLPLVEYFDADSDQPRELVQNRLATETFDFVDALKSEKQWRSLEERLAAETAVRAVALEKVLKGESTELAGLQITTSAVLSHKIESEIKLNSVDISRSGRGISSRLRLALANHKPNVKERSVIMLYDEPDTHLDYRGQRDIARMMQTVSDMGRLTVAATHSVHLIDSIELSGLVRVHIDGHAGTRIDAGLAASDEFSVSFLQSIEQDLGVTNSALLYEGVFVAVEGEAEKNSLPIFYERRLGTSSRTAGIVFWDSKGFTSALDFATYLNRNGKTVLFLVDTDTLASERKIDFSRERLEGAGFDVDKQCGFIGKAEFEDAFTDQQWANVANLCWPRLDDEDWQASHFASCRGEKKFSKAVEDLIRLESSKPETKRFLLKRLAENIDPTDYPDQLSKFLDRLQEASRRG